MNNRKRTAGILILMIVLLLFLSCMRPIIFEIAEVPVSYLDAVRTQARGLYSTKLPLLPSFVTVDRFVENKVFYTIYYFPFGSVGMSYTDGDGYNTEKTLSGLS